MRLRLASPRSLPVLLRLLSVLLLGTVLVACGGGDSTPPAAPAPLSTGTFMDAPTKGLFYHAYPSGLEGTTDAAGHFDYRLGDVVIFKLQLGAGTLTLGEFMPSGLGETVSVLALRRGGLVAQLLQSLDHSADSGVLDVGGLTLAPANFDALAAWLASDGQTLPAGKTAQQLLADAQAGADGNPLFTRPGAVSPSVALESARGAIHAQIASSVPGSTYLIENRLLLHTGYSNYGPVAQLMWFNGSTHTSTIISMTTDSTGAAAISGPYAINGDVVALPDGTGMRLWGNSASGLTSFSSYPFTMAGAPMAGAGNYRTLVNTPLDARGQMLTVRGYPACAYFAGTTFVFAADGQSWSAYCESVETLLRSSVASPIVVESGTLDIDPALPQLLRLTNSCGVDHYVGVLEGTLSSGRLAFLTPATSPSAVGRLDTGGVRQRGVAPAALLKPYTGSCASAGAGTPAPSFYTGSSLKGTFVGVAGLGASVHLLREGFYYASADVQLPGDASTAPVMLYQLQDTGSYAVAPPPGCTLQGGTGSAASADAFTVDCSNFASGAVYVTQGDRIQLFGSNAFPGAMALGNAPFTLSLPPLPDSVPLRICATNLVYLMAFGTPMGDWPCFAPGTGMAMAANPTPQTGMPLYVKPDSTAHNYYSSDRRVTTATATTVYVNAVSFLDGMSAGPFQLQVMADRNGNGLVDDGELSRAYVSWPTASP